MRGAIERDVVRDPGLESFVRVVLAALAAECREHGQLMKHGCCSVDGLVRALSESWL